MTKKAVEQTGLIPRSIIRTFERFRKQLLPGAETLVIQEFRISRYQVIVSIRCLLTLILVPLLINIFSKSLFITPITEFFWNRGSNEIFLNSYQQNRALKDIQNFEEKKYFEWFLNSQSNKLNFTILNDTVLTDSSDKFDQVTEDKQIKNIEKTLFFSKTNTILKENTPHLGIRKTEGQRFQQKVLEIANYYNQESIEAISNLFADFLSFASLYFLFVFMGPQIIILKSFLAESLYSLSDTTKSFLLILGTDLLVGFHSPRGWEVFLQWLLRHSGLPENPEFMSLFVTTFPVFLDTVFKYWIFRSLNKISPSTVATYHNMIE